MKTEPEDGARWDSPHPRWMRWVAEDPSSGWIMMAVFTVLAMTVDVAVAVISGDSADPWAAVFVVSGHEWWMRLMFLMPVLLATFVWTHVVDERNKRIAELRRTKTHMREMNSRLSLGDARVRRDMATRLHENVGQTVGAAAMYLSAIDQERLNPDGLDALRAAARSIARVMSEVRDIAQELQPMPQADFRLDVAVESMAERVMRRTGTSVDLNCTCSGLDIDSDVALVVYQVITEAVESAAGADGVSTIRIAARDLEDRSIIEIGWDSIGSENLLSSDEWLRSMGGDVDWSESADATTVAITLPSRAA